MTTAIRESASRRTPHAALGGKASDRKHHWPLIPWKAAVCLLARSEGELARLMDNGELGHCFDLRGVSATRREIRFSRMALLAFLDRAAPRPNWLSLSEASCERIIEASLPHVGAAFTSSQLSRFWSLSTTHVTDLVLSGLLKDISHPARKPNESRLISRASAVALLRARRLPQ
jgi:hypothetical protein